MKYSILKPFIWSLLTGALLAISQTTRAQTLPATQTDPKTSEAPTATVFGTPYVPAGVPTPPPLNKKDYQIFGTIRLREEDWNWFPSTKGNGNYTFLGGYARVGVSRATRTDDMVLEFSAPFLAGLPSTATAPAPLGAMGLGANYYAANHQHVADFFLKNGYVRFKNAGTPNTSVRLGRFEYSDGVEIVSADPSLNWIKQNRIGQRLLGPFGFSDVGRSFDGIQITNSKPTRHLTAAFMMPTRGVYDLNGWDTLVDNRIFYAAGTIPHTGSHSSSEGRLFALYYEDVRNGAVVKTDNRPAAARALDKSSISYATFGGNYERVQKLGKGKVDGMFWGAGQIGRWGTLRQGAFAFAAEAGYQPNLPLKPWLRFGYDYYSGDGNNANGIHGTFISPAPTPRNFARTPFFTESNLKDLFGEIILRPNTRVNLRADVHGLQLADSHDLWYSGGGAYDIRNFGYAGRTSSGHSNLGTLYDVSLDYQARRDLTLSLYFGYVKGGDVVTSIYRGSDLTYAYAESTFHF